MEKNLSLLDQLNQAKASNVELTASVASLPGLKTQVETLTAEKVALEASITALKADLAAEKAKSATDLAALKTAHEAALTAKDAEVETLASTKAAAIAAAAGAEPVKGKLADKPAGNQGSKTENREAFFKLPLKDQKAFILSGGLVTD